MNLALQMQPLWLAIYHCAAILFAKTRIGVLSTATHSKNNAYSDLDLRQEKEIWFQHLGQNKAA